MKLGVHYPSATDFPLIMDDIVGYEDAGAEYAWLGESYGYDCVSALGALAARTTAVQLGTAIMAVQTRTPALIAMTMAGLDALSGGRAILGLGCSGPQVIEGLHDTDFGPPLARPRQVIDSCRALWQGARIVSGRRPPGGEPYRPMKLMHAPARRRIPVFVAAVGPRNVELAAEHAEGWMPAFFWPERHQLAWGSSLERGLAGRAGDLGPLQLSVTAPLAIGADTGDVLARHRAILAHYLGEMGTADTNFYQQLARRYGLGDEAEAIRELYACGRKAEAAAAVPAELAEATSLIGPQDHVLQRMEAYAQAGVTILNLAPAGRDSTERVAQLRLARSLVDELRL
jgi:F420-dependent oxidoreductase-like protein